MRGLVVMEICRSIWWRCCGRLVEVNGDKVVAPGEFG